MQKTPKLPKPIGEVTHFFGHLGVVIVKFTVPVEAGTKLHYQGATTDFTEVAKSMQYDHADVAKAKKGQEVGIKVKEKAREGDKVYLAE